MGARQREWARRTREALLDKLGRQCAWCGATGGDGGKGDVRAKLTFDCIVPTLEGHKADHHRRYEWSWRMSFYRAQHARGNLQVLCDRCNSAKGQHVAIWDNELTDFDLPPLVTRAGQPF